MCDNVKALIAKAWKDETIDLEPGRHHVDELLTIHVSGSVEKYADQLVAPTTSVPLIATLALFWESVADVVRAYIVTREVYGLSDLWAAVEALNGTLSTGAQTAVHLAYRRLIDRAVRWLLANRRLPLDVPTEIAWLRPGVSRLLPELGRLFRGAERAAVAANAVALVERGLPADLADATTRVMYGFGLLDIVEIAHARGVEVAEVAEVYYQLSERLRVDDLLSRISALPRTDRWQTLARMALRYDLYAALGALTTEVLVATAPPVSRTPVTGCPSGRP